MEERKVGVKKMSLSKIVVLGIALLAVGTLVLPSTLTLFAGEHYWYNLVGETAESNEVPCQKCHADVFEELDQSNFHINWGDPGADKRDCEACHRSNNTITYALVRTSTTDYQLGQQAHAASVVACMLCHQKTAASQSPGVSNPLYEGPWAAGFNISGFDVSSPYVYSDETATGFYEAHNAFIAEAIKDNTLQDSNEACVACHTHTAVKINWTHARSIEFDVRPGDPVTSGTGPHNWVLSNWTVNGTAKATVWGNTTGNATTVYGNIEWQGEVPGVNYQYE